MMGLKAPENCASALQPTRSSSRRGTLSQAAPRPGITGRSRRPQELSRLAVGDERSELGLYCDEGCGREGDPTLACCRSTRKVRTDHAEECFDGLSALWTSLHEALAVRVTTLLNKLINLHGVRVTGIRFDVPELAPARAPPGGSELQSLQLGW